MTVSHVKLELVYLNAQYGQKANNFMANSVHKWKQGILLEILANEGNFIKK